MFGLVQYKKYADHCDDVYTEYGGAPEKTHTCTREPGHKGEHQDILGKDMLWSWSDGAASGIWWKNIALSGDPMYICSSCGVVTYWHHYGKPLREDICFYCDFWERRLNKLGTNQYIIGGRLYSVGDERGPKNIRGFGGSEFKIQPLGSEKVITTTDLWSGGKIPEHYAIPDTAAFV